MLRGTPEETGDGLKEFFNLHFDKNVVDIKNEDSDIVVYMKGKFTLDEIRNIVWRMEGEDHYYNTCKKCGNNMRTEGHKKTCIESILDE